MQKGFPCFLNPSPVRPASLSGLFHARLLRQGYGAFIEISFDGLVAPLDDPVIERKSLSH